MVNDTGPTCSARRDICLLLWSAMPHRGVFRRARRIRSGHRRRPAVSHRLGRRRRRCWPRFSGLYRGFGGGCRPGRFGRRRGRGRHRICYCSNIYDRHCFNSCGDLGSCRISSSRCPVGLVSAIGCSATTCQQGQGEKCGRHKDRLGHQRRSCAYSWISYRSAVSDVRRSMKRSPGAAGSARVEANSIIGAPISEPTSTSPAAFVRCSCRLPSEPAMVTG